MYFNEAYRATLFPFRNEADREASRMALDAALLSFYSVRDAARRTGISYRSLMNWRANGVPAVGAIRCEVNKIAPAATLRPDVPEEGWALVIGNAVKLGLVMRHPGTGTLMPCQSRRALQAANARRLHAEAVKQAAIADLI